MWGTDKTGNNMNADHHAFTGEDCYGKVMELVVDGSYDKFGFILTKVNDDGSWDKLPVSDNPDDGNREAQVNANGTAEVWIDGVNSSRETQLEAPADYKCKADKLDVTVHYMRNDGLYFNPDASSFPSDLAHPGADKWVVYSWNGGENTVGRFTEHDDWGEISRYILTNYTYANSEGSSGIGLLRRFGQDAWIAKDPGEGDVHIPANALTYDANNNAKAEVWLMQDDWTVYTARPALGARISTAEIAQNNAIDAKLTKPADVKAEDVKVTDAKGNTVDIDAVKTDGTVVTVTLKDDLDLTAKYTVEIEGFGSADAVAGSVVRTDAFDKEYAYDGDDLGATWADDGTTFKLWAPTASKVELVTFKDAKTADAEAADTIAMDRGEKGVWSTTAKVADGTAYIYRVSFADGTVNDSADPYARASVVNGKRSVVLSPAKTTVKDSGRMAPFSKNTDAVIAETHIRDLTKNENSGVDAAKRGKYLGMIQNGTKNSAGKSTGVDYLKELGITHVQIQPMFDYASVDETKPLDDSNYNWGYDPLNYNVPEGSYASDPTDPANRVVEAKRMVDGLHANGLRVIMDVVYNHVADAATNPFGLTVPGYYFRYQNGSLVNNSGCGNDTASERAMMRKYIVDSVAYWAKEYNMDGFRFDLMGLHDVETMKQVRSALDKIDPSIIIVGEGWDMNTTMDKSAMSIQPNGYKLDTPNSTIAFFNDSIRDGLKGSVFSDEDNGFVSGKQGMEPLIMNNMLGCRNLDGTAEGAFCTNGNANVKYANAGQVVNYVEIHDNLTLNDKLEKSLFVQGRNEGLDEAGQKAKVIETSKLANSAVFMAFGISEFQVGQEFLRTKGGDENSYKSGDTVNAVDWDRMNDTDYGDHAQYVKDLIAIRKKTSALRVESYKKISNSTKELKAADNVVAYEIARDNGTYVVALNAGDEAAAVPGVTAGDYGVLVSNGRTYLHPAQTVALADEADGVDASVAGAAIAVKDGQNVVVPAHSAVLLAPVADLGQPDTPDQPTKPDTPANPDEPGDTDKPAAGEQPGGNAAGSQSSTGAAQQVAGVASTGSAIALLVAVAVALVAAGAGLLIARRRD